MTPELKSREFISFLGPSGSGTSTLLRIVAGLALLGAPAQAQGQLRNGIEVTHDRTTLQVTALSDSIIRVRAARDGKFAEDASWAVPAEARKQKAVVSLTDNGFQTSALVININPDTLR